MYGLVELNCYPETVIAHLRAIHPVKHHLIYRMAQLHLCRCDSREAYEPESLHFYYGKNHGTERQTAIWASSECDSYHIIRLPDSLDPSKVSYVLCMYYFSDKNLYLPDSVRIEAIRCSENLHELSGQLLPVCISTALRYADGLNADEVEKMVSHSEGTLYLRDGQRLRVSHTNDGILKGHEHIVPRDGYSDHHGFIIFEVSAADSSPSGRRAFEE